MKSEIRNWKLVTVVALLALGSWLLAPSAALADDPPPPTPCAERSGVAGISCRYQNVFGKAGYTRDIIEGAEGNPVALRLGIVVRTALSLVGIVFLAITVYSGIQWMMAGGNEETVKKARVRLTRATIGLLIIVGAWIITTFVIGSALGEVRPRRGTSIYRSDNVDIFAQ